MFLIILLTNVFATVKSLIRETQYTNTKTLRALSIQLRLRQVYLNKSFPTIKENNASIAKPYLKPRRPQIQIVFFYFSFVVPQDTDLRPLLFLLIILVNVFTTVKSFTREIQY